MSAIDIHFAHSVQNPSQITSLAYGRSGHVFAGSDDGTLRVYLQSGPRVLKAISGLGLEISSIVASTTNDGNMGTVWLACGRQILSFDMDSHKLILKPADATATVEVSTDEDDALNELALSDNRKYLAFSLDTGVVGVVDLLTKGVSKMKTKHDNICGNVKFISGRPSEIVSGGYDQAFLHFDFVQRSVLSRHDLASIPSESGIALSPPFILSTSLSTDGVIAAATADGRLWLGFGGERHRSSIRKETNRSRRWNGLREADSVTVQVTEGPIVAIAFAGPEVLVICTLLGEIKQYRIYRDTDQPTLQLERSTRTKGIAKVNTGG